MAFDERTLRVVIPVVLGCLLVVLICVAIPAAVGTGVVGADVARLKAVAADAHPPGV